MNGSVLIYSPHDNEPEHERACQIDLGRRLSRILGRRFGGYHDGRSHAENDDPYVIAINTIVGLEQARTLGIHDETDLFGGVAPHSFIPTKAITHPLYQEDAPAPEGWSHDFGERVQHVVLAGYTVFSHDDAVLAAEALSRRGPVRIKLVYGTGGHSQSVVNDKDTLKTILGKLDPDELAQCGLVLEEQLEQVSNYSVGQVRVGGLVASYVGTQRVTLDNEGVPVYGGSELIVTRGDYPAIFLLPLRTELLLAAAQAQLYDRAATLSFPDFFASRRNYDIAHGFDAGGRIRCGVLGQSWRPGGASAAEILALETLHARPDVTTVKAATLETFGEDEEAPAHAIELFNGEDRDIGHIRKYVMLERYDNR